MRNPPAFQCYASDWLADEDFKLASLAERGLAFTMFLQCWVSDSVPAARVELAKVLGLTLSDIEAGLTPRTMRLFSERSDRLVRQELVDQKAEMMARRLEQSRGGKRGAKAKWGKDKKGMTTPLATPSASSMALEKKSADKGGGGLRHLKSNDRPILTKEEEDDLDAFKNGLANFK